MHVAALRSSKCALCAFRSSIWAPVFVKNGTNKRFLRIHRNFVRRGAINPSTQPHEERSFRWVEGDSFTPFFRKTHHAQADGDPYIIFAELIKEQWGLLRSSLSDMQTAAREVPSSRFTSSEELDRWLANFSKELENTCADAIYLHSRGINPPLLIRRLRKEFLSSDVNGLAAALRQSFESFCLERKLSKVAVETQRSIADFRYPIEWYPEARTIQRKIHLHVGPTNSGKTYQALQRLENAESGVYAGPLRLLAHEVYTRLNAKNKLCALITGEERRIPEGQQQYLTSCTVEMVPLNTMMDVAVIDEIQMMGDDSRGWAWTQAFLGVRAKEVHLCGEARTVPLIQQLCAMTGDSLEIHKYERLSPLETLKSSLKGDLKNLEKGDAIIIFSRVGIHSMKNEIEKFTGRRCAVVYGSLPPETRAQQANLFNDPNNDYDFLVSSDAVGMGLNLSIKRIIFESTRKRDDMGLRTLQISEIKQIAGRAGRYQTAVQAIDDSLSSRQEKSPSSFPMDVVPKKTAGTIGLVTTLQDYDMPILQNAMSSEPAPLATAGIAAPDDILLRFAAYYPQDTPLSYIFLRLHEISSVNPLFHLCRLRDQLKIADTIQEYDLTMNDRVIFTNSPASFREQGIEAVIKALAKCVADQSGGELLDIKEIDLELLDQVIDVENKEYLRKLESLHSALTLYLWLSYRLAGVFRSQAQAFHVKGILEEKIETFLSKIATSPQKKIWSNLLQQRTALSWPKVSQADKQEYEDLSPFNKLVNASAQKNALISMLSFSDSGQTLENEPLMWQASVSVIYEGEVVQATSTGTSQLKARESAAEAILMKISLGNNELFRQALHNDEISGTSQVALTPGRERNNQINVLAEGVSDGKFTKICSVS